MNSSVQKHSSMDILNINNLSVEANGKDILRDVSLSFKTGEIHVIMGPNGSGKSTLANVIIGNPKYHIKNGNIELNGEDIATKEMNERANLGIFLAFQNPVEIEGLNIMHFLKMIYKRRFNENIPTEKIKELAKEINLQEDILNRQLNFNLSGGEKKKLEFLQMMLIKPKVQIFDEIDSGIDIDSFKRIMEIIRSIKRQTITIIITHQINTAKLIEPDRIHVLIDGKISVSGGQEILDNIDKEGYKFYGKQN